MSRRVGGIEEFAFEPLSEGEQLHLTIAISGWLEESEDGKISLFKTCVSVALIISFPEPANFLLRMLDENEVSGKDQCFR